MTDCTRHIPCPVRLGAIGIALATACGPVQAQSLPAAPIPGPYQVMPAMPSTVPGHTAPAAAAYPQATMPVPYWMAPAPAVSGSPDAPAPVYLRQQNRQRWQLRFVPGWGWVPEQAVADGNSTGNTDQARRPTGPVAPAAPWMGYGPFGQATNGWYGNQSRGQW